MPVVGGVDAASDGAANRMEIGLPNGVRVIAEVKAPVSDGAAAADLLTLTLQTCC